MITNMKTILFLFIPISILFGSACVGIKTKLDKQDLSWLTPYVAGDMLIFSSSEGLCDTSYIVEKKVYYSDYKPNGITPKYIPQIGEIVYYNSKMFNETKKESIIAVFKDVPDKPAYWIVNYYNSLFSSDKYDNQIKVDSDITINGIRYQDIWLISGSDTAWKPQKEVEYNTIPRIIYWSKSFGLIKYVTYSGIVWELKTVIHK